MINKSLFVQLVENPAVLVLTTIVLTVLCLVVGAKVLAQSGVPNKALPGLAKSKSSCDVSEGLRKEELRTSSSFNSLANMSKDDRVLSAAAFREFKVLKITKISHNTKLLRFEIPHGKSLGLSVGRHITLRARVGGVNGEGTNVMRAYTPTSRPDQQGYFDLLVKSYEFGKLSPHLHSLRPGSSVEVRGPVGRFRYTPNRYVNPQSMGLVAGGTGLTPCLQVIRCVLEGHCGKNEGDVKDVQDLTCFTLLFQNRTEQDILLREELDGLAARFPGRLRVIYFLSNASGAEFGIRAKDQWSAEDGYGGEVRGYINAEAVRAILRPERCPFVCVCGPSGFNLSIKELLVKEGHVDEPADQSGSTISPTIFTW